MEFHPKPPGAQRKFLSQQIGIVSMRAGCILMALMYVDKKLALFKLDSFVKSLKTPFDVIPAKAGIQCFQIVLDACPRRHDGISHFLRVCQIRASGL